MFVERRNPARKQPSGFYLPKEPYLFGGVNQKTARKCTAIEAKAELAYNKRRAEKDKDFQLLRPLDKLHNARKFAKRRCKKALHKYTIGNVLPAGSFERAYFNALEHSMWSDFKTYV